MPLAGSPAFGRRAPGAAPRDAGPATYGRSAPIPELSAEAQAFAAQIRASRGSGGPAAEAAELKRWKTSRRAGLWSAAGPWKYWACLLGVLSLAVGLYPFGQTLEMLGRLCGVLSSVCAAVAVWRGWRAPRTRASSGSSPN